MKVIFISREGYHLPGARIRCYNFAKELAKYNVQTEVLSYKDQLGARDGQEEVLMEDTHRIWYNLKAFSKLSKEKNAILYIQRIHYHYLAPLLVHEACGNKLIFDMDDWDLGYNPFKRLSYLHSLKGTYLTPKIASESSGCVASSIYIEDYLSQFNNNTAYVPTGVDTSLFYPRNKTSNIKKTVFCWTGTMFREDNVENLLFTIDCFWQLNKKYPDIALQIIGTGPRMRNIIEVTKLKYPFANIELKGWIHPSDIPQHLSNIDIALFPLIQNTKFNHSKSPTKLFEYMAMKKPAVASKIGELSFVIKDGINGFLASTFSKKSFIEKMEILINDHKLRTEMGENALQAVRENFSLEVLGKKLYEFLTKLDK